MSPADFSGCSLGQLCSYWVPDVGFSLWRVTWAACDLSFIVERIAACSWIWDNEARICSWKLFFPPILAEGLIILWQKGYICNCTARYMSSSLVANPEVQGPYMIVTAVTLLRLYSFQRLYNNNNNSGYIALMNANLHVLSFGQIYYFLCM